MSSLVDLWIQIGKAWKQRRRLIAILLTSLLLLSLLIFGVIYQKELFPVVGRLALYIAKITGTSPEQPEDQLLALNKKIQDTEKKFRSARASEEKNYYQALLGQYRIERDALIRSQEKKTRQIEAEQWGKSEVFPGIEVIYSTLERISAQPGLTFKVIPQGDGLFSVEWKFTAFVIRNKIVKESGALEMKDTITMSDVLNIGRGFYLGGVVLKKTTTGVISASNFLFQELRPSKEDWVATKMALDAEDIFVGTIFTARHPDATVQAYSGGSVLGFPLQIFPLSLEDPSFMSISAKELSEKYGLISLIGILGPFLDPAGTAKLGPEAQFEMSIRGQKLSNYYFMAFKATGLRAVSYIAQTEKKQKHNICLNA